jgi:hypothetical protein
MLAYIDERGGEISHRSDSASTEPCEALRQSATSGGDDTIVRGG